MCPKLIELLSWNGPTVHVCMLARASTKTFVSRINIRQPSPKKTARKIFDNRKIRSQGHLLAEVSLYGIVGSAGEEYVSFPVLLRRGSINHVCRKFKSQYNYQNIKLNYASSDIFSNRQPYSSPAQPTDSISNFLAYSTANLHEILTKYFTSAIVSFILPMSYIQITFVL